MTQKATEDDEDAFINAIANSSLNRRSGSNDLQSKLKELEDTPIFMSRLPKDGQENIAFEAMQALVYDGSPEGMYGVIPLTYGMLVSWGH